MRDLDKELNSNSKKQRLAGFVFAAVLCGSFFTQTGHPPVVSKPFNLWQFVGDNAELSAAVIMSVVMLLGVWLWSVFSCSSRGFYKSAKKLGYSKSELRKDFSCSDLLGDTNYIYIGKKFCFILNRNDNITVIGLKDIVWAYKQLTRVHVDHGYFESAGHTEYSAALVTNQKKWHRISCKYEGTAEEIINKLSESANIIIGTNEEIAELYKKDFGRLAYISQQRSEGVDVKI